MANKKESIAERAKRLAGGSKPVSKAIVPVVHTQTDKVKKSRYVKKGGNGGKREGSGRKPLLFDEQRRALKRSWENFGAEVDEIEVETIDPITKARKLRVVKMQRIRVAQVMLYQNVKKGDTTAIKEFNDRLIGKSKQPIVGDDDDAPLRVDLGVDRLLDKAYGDDDA